MIRLKQWLDEARLKLVVTDRPQITLSYAQSLDGCLALRRGQPFSLSGPEARQMTHWLRSVHDGILVGIGTVLADDPRLDVRFSSGPDPRPVILDTHLRIPMTSKLLKRTHNLPWIICSPTADIEKQHALQERGVRIFSSQIDKSGHMNVKDFLEQLKMAGLDSLLVEGGAGVIYSFFESGLVDLAVMTIAPIWMSGLHVMEGKPLQLIPELVDMDWDRFGKDLVVWGMLDSKPGKKIYDADRRSDSV